MLKNLILLGSTILLLATCKDDSDKWTAVTFDNDTAIHVSKEIIHARLINKFETPFKISVEDRTYSQIYVCIPIEKIGADTIILVNPNDEGVLDGANCKSCTEVEISPIQVQKITELYLPTAYIKSNYNNRFPFFAGKIKWVKRRNYIR